MDSRSGLVTSCLSARLSLELKKSVSLWRRRAAISPLFLDRRRSWWTRGGRDWVGSSFRELSSLVKTSLSSSSASLSSRNMTVRPATLSAPHSRAQTSSSSQVLYFSPLTLTPSAGSGVRVSLQLATSSSLPRRGRPR